MEKKIPINLLTGVLGSGKTTLLKDLLAKNNGKKKIAVIMNEIGEISIDAKLLEGFSVDMFELNDGCICCSVNEDFVVVLDELAEKLSPDLIVIETTGVANPISIIYSLFNPRFVLDAVITAVDATNFFVMKSELEVVEDQVDVADVIIITKDDIATASEISKVTQWISDRNPTARIFSRHDLQLDLIFGISYPQKSIPSSIDEPIIHNHLQDIDTFRFQSDSIFELPLLQVALENMPPELWRLKGVIRLNTHSTLFILNFAYGRYTIEDYNGTSDYAIDLIFIGKQICTMKHNLITQLRSAFIKEKSIQ